MIEPTHTPPPQLWLEFDIEQTSPTVSWHVGTIAPSAADFHQGTLSVLPSTGLGVRVTGGGVRGLPGDPPRFQDFIIRQLGVMTRPQMLECDPERKIMKYAAPSPFSNSEAIHLLDLEAVRDELPLDMEVGYRKLSKTLKHKLEVGLHTGAWDLTLLLAVDIFCGEGEYPVSRVFTLETVLEVPDRRPGRLL